MSRRPPVVTTPVAATEGPLWSIPAGVASLRISPDGRVLAALGRDGVLRLADLELGAPTFELPLDAPTDLALAPSIALTGSGKKVLVLHAMAGRLHDSARMRREVSAVAVSHDAGWLAGLDVEGELRLYRAATTKRVLKAALGVVGPMAFAWGDQELFVGGRDGTVWRMSRRDPVPAAVVVLDGPVGVLRPTATGAVMGTATGAYDLAGTRLAGPGAFDVTLRGELVHDPGAQAIAAHPDGKHLVVATATGEVLVRSRR